jgi:hypothetical protein
MYDLGSKGALFFLMAEMANRRSGSYTLAGRSLHPGVMLNSLQQG